MNQAPTDSPRPSAVVFATFAMCFFNLVGVMAFYPASDTARAPVSFAAFAVVYAVVAAASFVVIWFFWQGRNWARWLVLATSILALLNLVTLSSETRVAGLLIVAEAALALWLLFSLNTARVKRFFQKPQRQ